MVHRYCEFLNDKLHFSSECKHKKLVHCIVGGVSDKGVRKKAVNAAFLVGAFAIVYLNRTAKEV